jgi:hypothetical protein
VAGGAWSSLMCRTSVRRPQFLSITLSNCTDIFGAAPTGGYESAADSHLGRAGPILATDDPYQAAAVFVQAGWSLVFQTPPDADDPLTGMGPIVRSTGSQNLMSGTEPTCCCDREGMGVPERLGP